ncbi:MAG TPA: hypothetical protein VMP01_04340, partial [Pirellulaceae bacterium]|nr:hypothetical protein [Pirellulaceae bacterium]
DSLLAKGLMIELTAPGRGQIVSHNLYEERELAQMKAQYAGGAGAPPAVGRTEAGETPAPRVTRDMFSELELEVAQLRAEVSKLREQVKHIALATGVSHSNLELGSDL